MREMTEQDKQFVDLYTKAINELHTGSHEATHKMLDFWGVKQPIENEEIYKRVQLMLEQEKYMSDPWGKVEEREWWDMSYRLGAYKDDFKAFVGQLINEYKRDSIPLEQLQAEMGQYNVLRCQMGFAPIEQLDPTQNNASRVRSVNLPSIRHGHTDDFEAYRWEEEDLKNYSSRIDKHFESIAGQAIYSGVPLIHISPEQLCSFVKAEAPTQEKQKEQTNEPKVKVKEGSQLANFLTKFAEKSIEAKNAVAQRFAKTQKPEPIGLIKEGMYLTIPANTTNMMTGQKLPEMTVEVYGVSQQGGQAIISTSAGVLTTREMSRDLHQHLQQSIAELTYKIEHAEEIRAKEEAFQRAFDYKHNWFSNMQQSMPELPRDDRLDLSDMRYFGYTPESFSASQDERSRDYDAGMEKYTSQAQSYSVELVQKCIDNHIRMIYAGDYRGNFEYYGPTPEMSSRPDFSYGQVPDKWTDEVYMPNTCIDAVTGEPITFDDRKMKDIWDTMTTGEIPNLSFGIVGETVNGDVVMITSIDIRDVARDMTRSMEQELDGNDEQNIGDYHEPNR